MASECSYKYVTIDEVLSLMKNKDDRFFVILQTDNKHVYRIKLKKDDRFLCTKIGSDDCVHNIMTVDGVKDLDIVRFDPEIIRRVLVEVRQYSIESSDRIFLNELDSLRNDLSTFQAVWISNCVASIRDVDTSNMPLGRHSQITELHKRIKEGVVI